MDMPLLLQLVPLIVVLAIIGVIIYAARRVREEAALGTGITPGIKGWLFLLAVGLILTPFRLLSELIKYYSTPGMANLFREFPIIAYTEAVQNGILLVAALATVAYMLAKKREFRTAFYAQYLIGVITLPLNYLMSYIALRNHGVDAQLFDAEGAVEVWRWIAMTLIGALWVAYVARSRRVAITFVK